MKLLRGLVIRNKLIVNILSLGFASGITLWPFIFIDKKSEESPVLLNHERIHIRQQLETLIIGFYLIYIIQFLYYRISNSRYKAYRKICFEREAYNNEENLEYLQSRPLYAWLIIKKK